MVKKQSKQTIRLLFSLFLLLPLLFITLYALNWKIRELCYTLSINFSSSVVEKVYSFSM